MKIKDGRGVIINDPDFADIVYHVFRCGHAHGEDIPTGYKLSPIINGNSTWIIGSEEEILRIPESIIWSLLAAVVFSSANSDIKTESLYCLSWESGASTLGKHTFPIDLWWGAEETVKSILMRYPKTRVILNIP